MSEKTPSFPLAQVLVMVGFLGVFLVGLLSAQPQIPPKSPVTPTVVALVATATVPPTEVIPPTEAQDVQAVAYTDDEVEQGKMLFDSTCFACHGMEGQGIPGLGKDLIVSTFVHDLSDDELIAFIAKGRPVGDPLNTTGVAMPARGGNPSLTDDKLRLITAFIRSQQAKSTQQATPVPTTAPAADGTEKPFVLPIDSLGLITATPTGQFVLPIESLGIVTPTESTASQTEPTTVPTAAPTSVPVEATTSSASTPEAGQFVLPIESLGFVTATPAP